MVLPSQNVPWSVHAPAKHCKHKSRPTSTWFLLFNLLLIVGCLQKNAQARHVGAAALSKHDLPNGWPVPSKITLDRNMICCDSGYNTHTQNLFLGIPISTSLTGCNQKTSFKIHVVLWNPDSSPSTLSSKTERRSVHGFWSRGYKTTLYRPRFYSLSSYILQNT